MQDKVKYIAEEYGIHHQLIKLMEEMSEVTKEITKLLNATDDEEILEIYRNTLPEELADLSLVYDPQRRCRTALRRSSRSSDRHRQPPPTAVGKLESWKAGKL